MSTIEDFQFEAMWPYGIEDGEPDVAQIVIRADSQIYTRLADVSSGETRDYLRASAVSLAIWLADNWWRLRYEPYPQELVPPSDWRLRHELTSASGGILWPPIMIYGEGTRIVFGPRSGLWDIPGPIRYLNALVSSVDTDIYERVLDAYFDSVIEHCSAALDGGALSSLVKDLRHERNDPEVVTWRRLEAQLGYDVDRVPEDLMIRLAKYQEHYGDSAVGEAAISAPGRESAETLSRVLEAATNSNILVQLDSARDLPSAGTRPTSQRPPWHLAEIAAAELRQRIGRPNGPIRDETLDDILGAHLLEKAPATARDLPYAALVSAVDTRDSFALQSPPGSRPRRFELARSLGDAAWLGNTMPVDNMPIFAPISHAKSDRQKFQRAFAQSFLCPFDDLMSYLNTSTPTDREMGAAAEHFDVSPRVVHTVLVNKQILPREMLDDNLEAA